MVRTFHRRLRTATRLLWLGGEVAFALAVFAARMTAQGGMPSRAARARWLQGLCRRSLRVLGLDARVNGPVPSSGLLVCNHLSYLDILVLSAITPCVFISKSEVKRWPVFGWFAWLAGTLFVRRRQRSDVARLTHQMRRVLDCGQLLVLFPEGTTSDGSQLLPFKSSLLEPAVHPPQNVAVGCIEYALHDGDVSQEVCYWKDMALVPHLLNLLGKRGLQARVQFANPPWTGTDRKELARQLYKEVTRLKTESIHAMAARPSCSCSESLVEKAGAEIGARAKQEQVQESSRLLHPLPP